MATVRQIVQESLSDFSIRHSQRNQQRQHKRQRSSLLRARLSGKIARLEDAETYLIGRNIAYRITKNYGCTTITTSCGLEFTYRPDKMLSWHPKGAKRKPLPPPAEVQESMFSGLPAA